MAYFSCSCDWNIESYPPAPKLATLLPSVGRPHQMKEKINITKNSSISKYLEICLDTYIYIETHILQNCFYTVTKFF